MNGYIVNVSDMVPNVMDAVEKQLAVIIDELLDESKTDVYELSECFAKHPTSWMEMNIWQQVELDYEKARFTLWQLCNMVEMMHGVIVESAFVEQLTKQVKAIVEGRLQYQIDKDMQEQQEEMNAELEVAV